jgi:hypothetical protein
MLVHPENMTDALEIDAELWVSLVEGQCQGRHFLLYNPHTFPGRIGVYCPTMRRTTRISKVQIADTSRAARYWLEGYLAGCEPRAPRSEAGEPLEHDDPRIVLWRQAIETFARTGFWSVSERQCQRCNGDMLSSTLGLVCHRCASVLESGSEES